MPRHQFGSGRPKKIFLTHPPKKKRCVYELEGVHNVGDANGYQPTFGIMHLSLWTYPRRTCMSKKQNERAVMNQCLHYLWDSI